METLAELNERDIYVHHDIGMRMDSLYIYLTKSVYFTNPITRLPFLLEELVDLERQMKVRHGAGVIDDRPWTAPVDTGDLGDTIRFERMRMDDDMVHSVNIHMDPVVGENTVRLMINVELPEAVIRSMTTHGSAPAVDPEPPPRLDPGGQLEEKGDEAVVATGSLFDDDVMLPLPSVVVMFLDKGRERRLKDQLSLIQFLQYEGAEIVSQMIDVMNDVYWHQQVWNQTSSTIIETVVEHIREHGPSELRDRVDGEEPWEAYLSGLTTETRVDDIDLSLEVQYSECWEIYRMLVLHVLERKYTLIARDLWTIDHDEFRVMYASHLTTVRQRCDVTIAPHSLILDILESCRSAVERGDIPDDAEGTPEART
jgi:hypothetical protein